MTTRSILLTTEWQRIADSSSSGLIQVLSGIAYLCSSDSTPTPEQPAHPRTGDINFDGINVYGRAGKQPVTIIVTTSN
ncbi:hypothetical protein ACLET0_14420 [Escherichia coli]|nr:hypothetical protein [Escherichia coli]